MDVKNFIDLHMHIGPEVIPRKYTAAELAEKEKGKIRGIAVKNHFYPTAPAVKELEEAGDLVLIGSVTLNNYVGGLNPDVIYASAKISTRPIIVWFPTINADAFLKQSKYEIPPEWVGEGFKSRPANEVAAVKVTDSDGRLTAATINTLQAIKDNDCILATGHLSWEDVKALVYQALKMGIKRIIITHPIYQLINMPIEVQKELAENDGVYTEHNYAMYSIDKIPLSRIAEQIRAVRPENCIISSDVGQVNSPSPSEALEEFTELLKQEGLTEDELKVMGEKNPMKLIEQDRAKGI